MGGDLNSFQGTELFYKMNGGHAWAHRGGGTSPSVLLNAPYHKKGEYIWLRGGDLNGFPDIKLFVIRTEWGMPGHAREDFSISVIECVLS